MCPLTWGSTAGADGAGQVCAAPLPNASTMLTRYTLTWIQDAMNERKAMHAHKGAFYAFKTVCKSLM